MADRTRSESGLFPDEETTRPMGLPARAAILVSNFRTMTEARRQELERLAERWAKASEGGR